MRIEDIKLMVASTKETRCMDKAAWLAPPTWGSGQCTFDFEKAVRLWREFLEPEN